MSYPVFRMSYTMKANYKNQIGDGKLPNKYWVFQYDEKFKRVKLEDGSISIEIREEDDTGEQGKDNLIGEFKTYQEALKATDGAYLPHVIIEDRLSGEVFEQLFIVCSECGKEEYETHESINFTKKTLGDKFI